ncbi:hypothetical protein AcV5_008276 [Taiwanofungus camphoratus]|nr:hypothetical protein AcV5_008276 [Antrodia cinnamomea]
MPARPEAVDAHRNALGSHRRSDANIGRFERGILCNDARFWRARSLFLKRALHSSSTMFYNHITSDMEGFVLFAALLDNLVAPQRALVSTRSRSPLGMHGDQQTYVRVLLQ